MSGAQPNFVNICAEVASRGVAQAPFTEGFDPVADRRLFDFAMTELPAEWSAEKLPILNIGAKAVFDALMGSVRTDVQIRGFSQHAQNVVKAYGYQALVLPYRTELLDAQRKRTGQRRTTELVATASSRSGEVFIGADRSLEPPPANSVRQFRRGASLFAPWGYSGSAEQILSGQPMTPANALNVAQVSIANLALRHDLDPVALQAQIVALL